MCLEFQRVNSRISRARCGQTSADMWISDWSIRVVVEERFALLAMVSHRVVLAVVTNAAADTTCCLIDRGIKVTPRCVSVTLATCTTIHNDTIRSINVRSKAEDTASLI